MMKWIPIAFVLMLTACSSESTKTYYQLPVLGSISDTKNTTVDSQGVTHQLWVERVNVADYLAGSGLVYQTSDVQYALTTNNLWASPLDQQLQQTLVTYLNRDLPGWLVSSQPGNTSQQDVLNVNVTGFHGRYDGSVVVSGNWVLTQGKQKTQRSFNLMLKQGEDGYDALVRTLAAGWQEEAGRIASQIR